MHSSSRMDKIPIGYTKLQLTYKHIYFSLTEKRIWIQILNIQFITAMKEFAPTCYNVIRLSDGILSNYSRYFLSLNLLIVQINTFNVSIQHHILFHNTIRYKARQAIVRN
jgi:hypothetical protein